MSSTLEAILRSWPFAPWLASALVLTAVIYALGWQQLRGRDPIRWHVGRLAAFLAGLLTFFVALASPIEVFSQLLLQAHMLQHLLLMMIAPPLVWLGWPFFPLLRGMPEPVRTYWVVPLLRSRVGRMFSILGHPLVAWPLYVAITWSWHTPWGYELGLASDGWHVIEHACFVAAALAFWYPVVRPYPSRPRWSPWLLFPYLLLADVQNTLLAAWLTFSPRVLYPFYLQVPRLDGLSALDDQRAAGLLMWVPGSIAFLLPLFLIGVRYLFRSERRVIRQRAAGFAGRETVERSARIGPGRPMAPSAGAKAADLLTLPLVGGFLRWRHGRRVVQFVLAALAAVVIFDGLRGPQVSPMNLAGTVPWIHWRGILILSLLAVGNLFCMACPFTLPRSLARRWLPGGRPWPRRLRSKWLAVALVAIFLWSYEVFSLWDSPWITAWITIGYFVAAFAVDSLFAGAAFCKYVCPIGQFNFVQSLMSPFEVTVRQPAVCVGCTTRECIRGSGLRHGCEMNLFQPRKSGNLDCTFCLDCVHVCPHQNVGLLAVIPGRTLWRDRLLSGIGRFSRRPDLAALVLVLVFGAYANAAGMIAPVVAWQDRLRLQLGRPPQIVVTTAFYAMALVAVPLVAISVAAAVSRRWSHQHETQLSTVTRYAFALVPIGFAMWLAHYSFHLFTSWDVVLPATQRFVADRGWHILGAPIWQLACCRPPATWVTNLQVLMLDGGLLASLYVGFRIAELNSNGGMRALKAFSPWAVMIVSLFLLGVWIVFQPMEMRGTLPWGT